MQLTSSTAALLLHDPLHDRKPNTPVWPPVVPSFRFGGTGVGGCQEIPVIPNLRRYDWRCRVTTDHKFNDMVMEHGPGKSRRGVQSYLEV